MTLSIFLVWLFATGTILGSFINVIAVRVMADRSWVRGRSMCCSCQRQLKWFELIPLLSWIYLRGKCRSCSASISFLYPLIELAYGLIFVALFYRLIIWSGIWELHEILFDIPSWLELVGIFSAHALFFGALLGASRADFDTMMIPHIFSVWLVPVGIILSFCGFTECTVIESLCGAGFGYGILWLIAWTFRKLTGKDGIGEGDFELLAMIGSFLGPLGVWFSILSGSVLGTAIAFPFLLRSGKDTSAPIPFGPFLALGAITFFFFKNKILYFFFGL